MKVLWGREGFESPIDSQIKRRQDDSLDRTTGEIDDVSGFDESFQQLSCVISVSRLNHTSDIDLSVWSIITSLSL